MMSSSWECVGIKRDGGRSDGGKVRVRRKIRKGKFWDVTIFDTILWLV